MHFRKDFKWDRKTITEFMEQTYGVKLSHMMATEAYMSCEMNGDAKKSDTDISYNKDALIKWIQINIPSLQSLEKHRIKVDKRRDYEKYNKLST